MLATESSHDEDHHHEMVLEPNRNTIVAKKEPTKKIEIAIRESDKKTETTKTEPKRKPEVEQDLIQKIKKLYDCDDAVHEDESGLSAVNEAESALEMMS